MKEVRQVSKDGSSSSSGNVESMTESVVTKLCHPKLRRDFNAGLVTLAVVSLMIVMQIKDSGTIGFFGDIKRLIHPVDPQEEVDMPQRWNHSSREFLPAIVDWDEQRSRWIGEDPNLKMTTAASSARPTVLMATGSSQDQGELYLLSHLLLRAAKNKQDYTQMHGMELFYNMVNPNPEFSDWWVKLPVVRMLMLRHPEVEWIWWLDADAVITEMTFEPPFAECGRYNLVLFGEGREVVLQGDSLNSTAGGLSTGVFLIRNCQWSLDLLSAWASSGTSSSTREEEEAAAAAPEGKSQVRVESSNRTAPGVVPGDDRWSLVALLAQDSRNPAEDQKWVPKVKLITEESKYAMNGNWTAVAPRLDQEQGPSEGHEHGHGVPFITHFEGCLPHPSEVPRLSRQDGGDFHSCVRQVERAFDFAENQVFKELGLERSTLGNSSAPFTWRETVHSANFIEESTERAFRILPVITAWDQKRNAYMALRKSWIKKDLAVILSGSPPTPCPEKAGSHLLVRGLKNKIDYSRLHGFSLFYNMAIIHETLTGCWSKLPAMKLMMLNSPEAEWIWWMDSDAVLTSMDVELMFDRYNADGHNLVLWGDEHEVFDLKKYNGISTGNMLIRNCQWSLDLFDRWASLWNLTEEFLSVSLDRPPMGPADDQSALVYLLLQEREKWATKVYFENDVVLSGEWKYWTSLYVDEYEMRADSRPLTTHFAGCHPCLENVAGLELCLERYDRTYNFADNQVLETYGLRHERLNSSLITADPKGDAQLWTHHEIESKVTKSLESEKDVGRTKEEVEVEVEVEPSEEDQNVDPAEKQAESVKVDRPEEESQPGMAPKEMEVPQEEKVEPTVTEDAQVEVAKQRFYQDQEKLNETEEGIPQREEKQEALNTAGNELRKSGSSTFVEKFDDP